MEQQLLKELDQTVKNLTEAISTKFSVVNTKQAEDEKNKLVDRVLELEKQVKDVRQAKAIRKMAWSTGQKAEEGQTLIGFNQFLKAVNNKDHAFLSEMKTATGNNETTGADGGYAIPVEYLNEIIALERQSSIIRQKARILEMGSLTRKIPSELTKPTISWAGEGVEATVTKPTLGQITQTAKKMMALVTLTTELLEDTNVNYDKFIAEVVATEMGREEDKQAFVGDVSGVADPFNGVYFASGVNSVSPAGGSPVYDDLVNMLMSIKAPYRARGSFVLSTTALKMVMKLKDDENRPIWSMPESGAPGRLMGRPYDESDQIPDTLGTTRTNGTNTAILFGAWDGLLLSPRGGYSVSASDSASNSSGKSAFTLDEVWFKFRRRESIDVVNAEAFAKMAIVAS